MSDDPTVDVYPIDELEKTLWWVEHGPERLTEFDFRVLKFFGKEYYERGLKAKQDALFKAIPPATRPTSPAPQPAPPPPPAVPANVVTKDFLRKQLELFAEDAADGVVAALKKVKSDLTSDIDRLRKQHTELSARVKEVELELEARDAATRMVPDVDR